MDIYHEAREISNLTGPLLLGISLGRDSACMLDLFFSVLKLPVHKFVIYHYAAYLEMLPYQARHLSAIEAKYGFTAVVRPDPLGYACKGIVGVAADRDSMLAEYSCTHMVIGYRMDESLQRRGMLKALVNGINKKTKECYPLRSWTSRISDAYVKTRRIKLGPEYAAGIRDCRVHRGPRAVWLRDAVGENDYDKACEQDPQVAIDYARWRPIVDARKAQAAGLYDGDVEEDGSTEGAVQSTCDQRQEQKGSEKEPGKE